MHWREGFRRSARAAAVVYWLGAAVIVGGVYHDTVYEAAYQYRRAHPTDAWGEFDPVVTNNLHVIVPAPPPPPKPDFTMIGVTAAAKTFGWCLVVYAALLGVFRGLRWIGRGFIDGRPA